MQWIPTWLTTVVSSVYFYVILVGIILIVFVGSILYLMIQWIRKD